jgi:hypothetical protein
VRLFFISFFDTWYFDIDFRAIISINNLSLVEGKLPPRILGLVMEWAELHKNELLEDWDMVQKAGKWFKIEPLV